MKTKIAAAALAGALALGLGTQAMAQGYGMGPAGMGPAGMGPEYGPGPGMGPRHGMRGGPGHGRGFGPGARFTPGAALEGRLAALKAELKISPAQETSWDGFASVAKTQAQAMQNWRTTMQAKAPATAVERSELQANFMRQRAEQMEQRNAAFKGLYAALTPEQKAIADQHFGGGMAFGYGRGGRFR